MIDNGIRIPRRTDIVPVRGKRTDALGEKCLKESKNCKDKVQTTSASRKYLDKRSTLHQAGREGLKPRTGVEKWAAEQNLAQGQERVFQVSVGISSSGLIENGRLRIYEQWSTEVHKEGKDVLEC